MRHILAIILAVVISGCEKAPSTASLAVKSWSTFMLPSEGATRPTPRSMAAGPLGQLAVLDTAGRVLIYDSTHTLRAHWKMLDVQFGKPEGIVWLRDNTIVVCDTHYNRLVWFTQGGTVIRTVGTRGEGKAQFIFPVGICKDPEENLYVCEYGGHDRIQVFTKDGEWLREFGSAGTGPGQFQRASGLVWHAGHIFVCDAVNHRIHRFKADGTYVDLLGGGALSFNLPYDITLGPENAFYIIEYGAGRLSKVTPEGRLVARYGETGTGAGQFATPWGLTSDTQGRIIVADTKNRRVVVLGL